MKLPLAATLAALAVLLLGCTSDNPAPTPAPVAATATDEPTAALSPTAPPSSPTAAPSPPPTATEEPAEPEALEFTLGDSLPLPDDIALIIELGCTGCDTPTPGYIRVYKDPSGTPRIDWLFERIEGARRHPPYIAGAAALSDGSDMVVSVCSEGSCGGLRSPVDPHVELYRSRDGGVTWTVFFESDEPWLPFAILDEAVVLGKFYDGRQLGRSFEQPAGTPVDTPVLDDGRPVASVDGRLVWQTDDGKLLFDDGTPATGLRVNKIIMSIQDHPGTERLQYITAAPDAAQDTRLFTRRGFWSAVPVGSSTIIAAANVGKPFRPELVLIDLSSGLAQVIELPYDDLLAIRGPLTLIRGPFARVIAGEGSCLNVRERPAIDAPILDCAADSVLLRRTGAPEPHNGTNWLPVTTPAGTEGWASTAFLEF